MNSYGVVSTKIAPHNSVRPLVLLSLLVFGTHLSLWTRVNDSSGEESLGTLKVISIRKMTGDEYRKRIKDYVGATHLVRLRFEAPSEKNVFLYAPYCGKPTGYVLERTRGRVRWLAANPDQDSSKSPGFSPLENDAGSCWLLMTAGSAYEWEMETEPRAPTEEARSVFVREKKDHAPVELVSSWYTISKEDPVAGTRR